MKQPETLLAQYLRERLAAEMQPFYDAFVPKPKKPKKQLKQRKKS